MKIVFIYAQIFGAFWKCSHALEILGSLRIFLSSKFEQIMKVKKLFFVTAHHPGCSSHMKVNMLGRPTLLVLLLLSMGSSKDSHKVSHFLPLRVLRPASDHFLHKIWIHLCHPKCIQINKNIKMKKKHFIFYYTK